MDDAFLVVVVLVSVLALAGAILTLATSGGAYDRIGRGGLSLDEPPPHAAATPRTDRDDEIRQMLAARNARRMARGEEPVDVEAELQALTAPAADPALAAEIRELVEGRNARRIARGKEPLDVEAEVERHLRHE